MSLVKIDHLKKTFGTGHTAIKAVDEVSLSIQAGEIVLIMGPSGSGKTTLISMAGTLMKPTDGSIKIDGQDIAALSASELSDFRLNKLGFVFQSFNLLASLNAEQNVMIPLLAKGVSKSTARAKARDLLTRLGVEKRLHHLPKDLSGGEKQRVAVARALVNEPKVILADEPTANLDTKSGKDVTELLCNIACAEGKAVIIVSHDVRLRDVAKRILTIEDGRLIKEEAGAHDKFCPIGHKNR